MTRRMSWAVWMVAAGLVPATASCASLATIAEAIESAEPYEQRRELTGEVRSVNGQRREIEIASRWGGVERVSYDGATDVVHGQRRYDIRYLERGDVVTARVDSWRGGWYATRIHVQQLAQNRSGSGQPTGTRRLEGVIVRLDDRRSTFDIAQGRGSTITVVLPAGASRAMTDRFRGLRRGDEIRVEAQTINTWTVELRRFL